MNTEELAITAGKKIPEPQEKSNTDNISEEMEKMNVKD